MSTEIPNPPDEEAITGRHAYAPYAVETRPAGRRHSTRWTRTCGSYAEPARRPLGKSK